MDTKIYNRYLKWLNSPILTKEEKEELKSIENDEKEITERFISDLTFGTAGLRGIMTLGTNRMNKYVVRHATQGLANYLLKNNKSPKVAIAFDSRNNSHFFALEAANVLASNGIVVYIYKELMPTPALSFAVRYLHCDSGIVITASHNPKMYNGYKCYGNDGCQMTDANANAVYQEIEKIDMFDVKYGDEEKLKNDGLIITLNDEVANAFIESDFKQALSKKEADKRNIKITYTPLNGAGYKCVTTILKKDGFDNISVVEEQKDPNGDFPTAPYPNPEMKEALKLGIDLMLKNNDDVLLATDPDSDRLGVVVNQKGQPIILTGNEVGILMFDYCFMARKLNGTLPEKPFAVKTIVSSDLVSLIAKKRNIELHEVLTGFKYIGEQILFLEEKGEKNRFIFGYEESCGYLTNPEIRDKDAVNASLILAEAANYYKNKNMTLYDRLMEIYQEFGDYKTITHAYEFAGLEGKDKISQIMKDFRSDKIKSILNNIDHIGDYDKQKIYFSDHIEETNLPKSNVIKFFLTNGETITIRPSGTEPKLKAYIFAFGEKNLNKYTDLIDTFIKGEEK